MLLEMTQRYFAGLARIVMDDDYTVKIREKSYYDKKSPGWITRAKKGGGPTLGDT
jgi:hypothetical protein